MSRKANPRLIGFFVIGALALAVAVVVVVGSINFFAKRSQFVMYFESSVNGLNVGSPVKFKGVPVGRVKEIRIYWNQPDDSSHIPVFIEIDHGKLEELVGHTVAVDDDEYYSNLVRKRSLRGQLVLDSFISGLLFVDLDFMPGTDPVFVQEEPQMKEIPTVPSALSEIGKTAQNIAAQLSQIDIGEINDRLISVLSRVEMAIDEMNVSGISSSVEEAAAAVRDLASSPELGHIVTNLDGAITDLRSVISQIDESSGPMLAGVSTAAEEMTVTLRKIREVAEALEQQIGPGASLSLDLQETLDEFGRAARAIRQLASFLERNPNALLGGRAGPESR